MGLVDAFVVEPPAAALAPELKLELLARVLLKLTCLATKKKKQQTVQEPQEMMRKMRARHWQSAGSSAGDGFRAACGHNLPGRSREAVASEQLHGP